MKFPNAETVVLIDANGRVGSIPDMHVGTCQPEVVNENGEMLYGTLAELEMFAENTFVDAGHTWVSGHGTKHRIDYILLSEKMHE
eukprot:6815058-Karenia_brevis.AAC.1